MQSLETKPFLLDIHSITLRITHEEFEKLCQDNPDIKLELTANGELIINESTGLGKAFSLSTIFTLPNSSRRSPDVAWVELSRWEALPAEERKKFARIAPDFVIELRSETDRLSKLQEKMEEYQEKMEEYRANGVRLGWLINPQQQQVEIYRIGREVEILEYSTTLSGEDVLSGFTLDLSSIF
jgi:Uma2 family endonuclease